MSKDKWEVQMFDGDGDEEDDCPDFELSVIRIDNKHGHDSWGWGDVNKIILFGSGVGENSVDSKEEKEFAVKVAGTLCAALNKED